MAIDAWWPKRFPNAIFGTRRSGFYLFRHGKHAWFHSGYVAVNNQDIAFGILRALFATNELLDPFTRKRINAVANALEAHIKVIEAAKPAIGSSSNEPTDPYTVLGSNRSASNDEVHQAYRKKMAANHPDRVAHLDAEIQTFAEAKVKNIQAAYDAIKKERRLV